MSSKIIRQKQTNFPVHGLSARVSSINNERRTLTCTLPPFPSSMVYSGGECMHWICYKYGASAYQKTASQCTPVSSGIPCQLPLSTILLVYLVGCKAFRQSQMHAIRCSISVIIDEQCIQADRQLVGSNVTKGSIFQIRWPTNERQQTDFPNGSRLPICRKERRLKYPGREYNLSLSQMQRMMIAA